MASILPFIPLRYNPGLIPDLGSVIAPPYDVISADKKRALIRRDPHNVIRLILPDADGQSKYANAAALLDDWIASGILIREPAPALYIYSQTFTHPVSRERVERRGVLGMVRLEPFSAGVILPHERTMSDPKADRLALMHATNANLEPIFCVYRDAGALAAAGAWVASDNLQPIIVATDADGVEHQLWRVTDAGQIRRLREDVRQSVVFIVDGHHRYETALAYQAERRAADPSITAEQPFDSILMFLAPMSDPGVIILPTHRVVHSLPGFGFDELLNTLKENFEATECASAREARSLLLQNAGRIGFALISGNRSVFVRLRDGTRIDAMVDPLLPEALKELDVTVLHDYILERMLGIDKQAQTRQTNLRYVKSDDEAIAEAGRPDVQLVAMMNATRLDQVERVAESGSVMPQKSTFFYPKLASGLVFNMF